MWAEGQHLPSAAPPAKQAVCQLAAITSKKTKHAPVRVVIRYGGGIVLVKGQAAIAIRVTAAAPLHNTKRTSADHMFEFRFNGFAGCAEIQARRLVKVKPTCLHHAWTQRAQPSLECRTCGHGLQASLSSA